MSDFESMNDPELEQLERLLQSAAPTPAPGERERMLYACGLAAGRAETGRRARLATAAAAVLGCVALSLAVMLWVREPAGMTTPEANGLKNIAKSETPSLRQTGETVGSPIVPFRDSDVLRVGSPMTALADLDTQSKGTPSDVGPIELDSTPSLTVSSPFRYEDLIQ